MEHYGSITTPVSVPRLIVGAMLAAGVAVLIMAFTKYGLLAGLAVSVIPAALCILWVTLRNPAISMLGLFVVNYFIMTLTRYAYDLPFGMILDALIFYNFLIITLQALMRPIEWKRASSGLTVVAAIWMAYCILEIVNPESVSVAGWFSSVRSIAFYFFFIVVLTQLTMTEYKYLKYMLAVWSVLTLIAVGKACMQKFFGFNAAENYWLFVLGGRSTHIIHSGVRYFSFFSDAANFGGSMGLSMVVFSISALYYRNSWMKLYLPPRSRKRIFPMPNANHKCLASSIPTSGTSAMRLSGILSKSSSATELTKTRLISYVSAIFSKNSSLETPFS